MTPKLPLTEALTYMQSDQAQYCWLTNFKFSSQIFLKFIIDSSRTSALEKFCWLGVKNNHKRELN